MRLVRRRKILVGLAILLAWAAVAGWLVPSLIRDAYREESLSLLNRLIEGRAVHPVEFYLQTWYRLALRLTLVAAVLLVAAGLAWRARGRRPPWPRIARAAGRWGLRAGFLIAGLWAVASLTFPFGWDHGIIASVGEIATEGGLPYRDAWDMKGPLAYYAFAAVHAALGTTMWGIRLLDAAWLVVACVVVGRAADRLTTARAHAWAGLALFLWYASLGFFFTAQPDGWVGLGLAAAFAPLLGRRGPHEDREPAPGERMPFGAARVAVPGLAVGLASLVKPVFALFLLVPVADLVLAPGAGRRRRTLGRAALLFVSFLAPLALAVAWFGANGALDDLVAVHLLYPATSSYSGVAAASIGPRVSGVFSFLWRGEVALALPIVLYGAWIARSSERRDAALLAAWSGAALLAVALQGKFFEYHWIPLFPPLVVLGAVGLGALAEGEGALAEGEGAPAEGEDGPRRTAGPARPFAAIALAALLVGLAASPVRDVGRWLARVTQRVDAGEYYDGFRLPGAPYSAGADMRAARYIRDRTAPSEGLVVFGTNATIHYLSGRPNPTRFLFGLPLVSPGRFRPGYREEFMRGLRRRPPAYIVVGMTHDNRPKEEELAGFEELAAFLDAGYELDRRVGPLDLYRRTGGSGPADRSGPG